MIDAGKHTIFVVISLVVLIVTMISYYYMETAIHFLLAGFLFGLGYGILQPLFQSFVTGTAPAPKRGAANATYLLSYDIGIGIGSLIMGVFQENIGITKGMAVTAAAYIVGGLVYILYVDKYYSKLVHLSNTENVEHT
jgi:predicted MFS family arabinose efflux permease